MFQHQEACVVRMLATQPTGSPAKSAAYWRMGDSGASMALVRGFAPAALPSLAARAVSVTWTTETGDLIWECGLASG